MMRRMSGKRTRKVPSAIAGGARAGVALGLLAILLFLAVSFAGIAVQGNAVAREADALRSEIAAAQQRKAALEAEAAAKSTDTYVVDKARELGYVRPGESLTGVQKHPSEAGERVAAAQPSRLSRWIALFFSPR